MTRAAFAGGGLAGRRWTRGDGFGSCGFAQDEPARCGRRRAWAPPPKPAQKARSQGIVRSPSVPTCTATLQPDRRAAAKRRDLTIPLERKRGERKKREQKKEQRSTGRPSKRARRKTVTSWRPDFNPDHLYFVTSSAVQHRHLFRRDVIKRLVVDSLDCVRLRERIKLYVFVIMPNHQHVIIQCRAEDPLADVIRDLKKHIADRLIRHYQVEGNQSALDFLYAQQPVPAPLEPGRAS
jgi:REP element-mobilizing transposase RayT